MGLSRDGAHTIRLPFTHDPFKRAVSRAFAPSASRGRITGMTKHKFSVRLTPLVFALGVSLVAGCSPCEELTGSEGGVNCKSTGRGARLRLSPHLSRAT